MSNNMLYPSFLGAQSCDAGCNGGLMMNAMEYVMQAGLDAEDAYPYKGTRGDQQCHSNKTHPVAHIHSFTCVPQDEEQMMAYMMQSGPLAIAVNALWMQFYVKGVSCPYTCDPAALDHGVLLVGWGDEGFSPSHLLRSTN